MRTLLTLLLLSAAPAYAQLAPDVPLRGEWVGTMEGRDDEGFRVGRVRLTLDLRDPKNITGNLRTPAGVGASGLLTGTQNDKGQIRITMTFYAGSAFTKDDGTREILEAERCQGESRMNATLHGGTVLRLTTDRVRFDTPALEAQDRHCQDLREVVITLQPLALIAR